MPQTFRQALEAKLQSITELTALVGNAIYTGALPQTRDLNRDGPAITWTVTTNPRNHHIFGSDGTSTARVQLSAWGYQISQTEAITNVLFNAIDGVFNDTSWGDGSLIIMSCLQVDESDLAEPARTGGDIWDRQIANEYEIKYRVTIPTHT